MVSVSISKTENIDIISIDIGDISRSIAIRFQDAFLTNLPDKVSQDMYILFLFRKKNGNIPITWESGKIKRVVGGRTAA